MRLTKLEISNFRGIDEIEATFDRDVSVVVGQNAIGKTTLLEAIRLAKTILSPRFHGESAGVLQQLGVTSPHHQFFGLKGIDSRAFSADISRPTVIKLELTFSEEERDIIRSERQQFARLNLQSRLGNDFESNQEKLAQFLSDSLGKSQLESSQAAVDDYIKRLDHNLNVVLKLSIDHSSGMFTGANGLAQQAVSIVERSLPPALTKFSYYQADRSFPQGEVQVQLGSQDAQQLVQSHMSSPALKYQRLKISIAAGILAGRVSQSTLEANFAAVFDNLLPGKSFSRVEISQIGVLRVVVRDKISGKEFDIDGLSSGEKGLVLTFLSLFESLAADSIVLLDEPELHLNPGVTRNITKVLLDGICAKTNAQVILTTHSAEILSDAYESDKCRLYAFRGPKNLSPIYPEDNSKVIEILNDLGVTTADVLFNKGYIFVEGPHDVELITEGFGDLLSSFKITKMGGRTEVEKAIRTLGKDLDPAIKGKRQLFILDGDRKKTDLVGNQEVRVLQWSKYCLENYLIDDRVLYNVIKENTKSNIGDRAEFVANMKALAFDQIRGIALRKAYSEIEPENTGLRPYEIKGKSTEASAKLLWERIELVIGQLKNLDQSSWLFNIIRRTSDLEQQYHQDWAENWRTEADGKLLLEDIFQKYVVNVDRLAIKRRIMRAMKTDSTENWQTVRALISAEIN